MPTPTARWIVASAVAVVAVLSFAAAGNSALGEGGTALDCYSEQEHPEDGTPAPSNLTLYWSPYWENGQLIDAITYLNWEDNSDNESCFIIEFSAIGGGYVAKHVVVANVESHSLGSFGCEKYRVYAVTATGRSAYSNEVSVTYNCSPHPGQTRADLNCDDSVDPVDALLLLNFDAGNQIDIADQCIWPDALVDLQPSPTGWGMFQRGDLNCDEAVNPVDALAVLRQDAGVFSPLGYPCIAPDRVVWLATG